MTEVSDERPDGEAEPQTHAEAISRIRGVGLPEEVVPNVQSEEAPGALSPKEKGE